MAKAKSKPAGGAIDVTKLRSYVDGHAALLKRRAGTNGEIRKLLNDAADTGFDKKAIESVSKRKTKNLYAEIAHMRQIEEYEVALGLATADMFSGDYPDEGADADAHAEARGDSVPADPAVPALPAPATDRQPAKKAKKAKKATAKKKVAAKKTAKRPSEIIKNKGSNGKTVQPTDLIVEAGKRAARAGWPAERNPYQNDKASQTKWAEGHEHEMALIKAADSVPGLEAEQGETVPAP